MISGAYPAAALTLPRRPTMLGGGAGMAVEDLYRAAETLKSVLPVQGFDLSYYVVLASLTILILVVSFTAGIVLYRFANSLANLDTFGVIKSLVIVGVLLLFIGILAP